MTTMNIYDLTDTWNAGGTTFNAIKMNVTDTASAAASLLMDLQVGGASKFSISKAGSVLAPIGSAAAPTFAFGVSNTGWYSSISGSIVDLSIGGTQNLRFSSNGMFFTTAAATVQVSSGGSFSFSSGTAGAASADTILARDAANTLAQRNGVNAQTFRVYNTYTDASNYERGFMQWSANFFEVGTVGAGTGNSARSVRVTTTGAGYVILNTSGSDRWWVSPTGALQAGADNTYDIGASGANRPRNLFLAGGVTAGTSFECGSGDGFVIASRAIIRSFANGTIQISNAASNDFNRLQFGGTTSSFPALKRSTTSLQARLADDSAFTNIQGKLTTETAYTAGAPTATGYIVLYDSTGTAYKIPAEAL